MGRSSLDLLEFGQLLRDGASAGGSSGETVSLLRTLQTLSVAALCSWRPQRTLAADTPFGSGSVDGPEVPGITGKASGTTKAIKSTKAPL
jgi:hypothetical protein